MDEDKLWIIGSVVILALLAFTITAILTISSMPPETDCGSLSGGARDDCCLLKNADVPHIVCAGAWKYVPQLDDCMYVCSDEYEFKCPNGLRYCQDGSLSLPDPYNNCRFTPCTGDKPRTTTLQGFCGSSTGAPCKTDEDCTAGGCSGQVCAGVDEGDLVTTCEMRDCYDNERYGLECGCAGGKCMWH